MYKVFCDDTLICDSRIEELALINPKATLEENKAGSFSFIIPPEHPKYDLIEQRKSIVQVYQNEELRFSGMCIEINTDFYKQKNIYCEGELSYFNDSIQRPARYQNATVRGLLEAFINNHNAQVEESKRFTVGMVTVTDPNDSLYCYTNMETTMECLKKDLVDDLGGFIRIRHEDGVKYIDYLADSQNTNTQTIKFGKNLMDFTTNINSSDIATAIIPLGATLETSPVEGLEVRLTIEAENNGSDYVYSQEAVDNYGWIFKTVEFDDVTTPSILKTKGEKYLQDIQFEKMVIEAKAIDLHLTNKEIETFKLSDSIRVVSAPHGLDKYFRLTKQTLELNNPEKDTITLGKNEYSSLSAQAGQLQMQIKNETGKAMKQAVANATSLIASAMGGYVVKTNDELLIMDTDNIETAKNVWRWNINGLAYSSNGYDGPYALAMTMDGSIVADAITTGVLKSIEINNGDGKFTVGADGNVTAISGNIGDWNIGEYGIYNDTFKCGFINIGAFRIYAGRYTYKEMIDSSYETDEYPNVGITEEGMGWFQDLYVNNGSPVATSDRNEKNSIEELDLETSSTFVYALKPCKYKYNNGTSDRFHHGFIAQDVQKSMSEDWGVFLNMPNGKCGLRYEELIADLVATVQSQNARIQQLEERLGEYNG